MKRRTEKKTQFVQIRLERSLHQFLRQYVAEKHTTVSQLFRDFIVKIMVSEKRKG